MLAIKFKRIGKKHQASFRVVVAEKKSKVSGNFVEDLGFYNPHSKETNINQERALFWMSKGAQPTDSVYNLMVREKVVEGDKRRAHSNKNKGGGEKQGEAVAKVEEKKEVVDKMDEVPVVEEEKKEEIVVEVEEKKEEVAEETEKEKSE